MVWSILELMLLLAGWIYLIILVLDSPYPYFRIKIGEVVIVIILWGVSLSILVLRSF